MTPPPLLLCDLDDTLIDRRGALRRWAEAFAAEHGLDGRAVDWLLAFDRDGGVDRRTYLDAARERFGLRPSVDALVDAFAERLPLEVRPPPPECLAAIGRLRVAGWRIGVVTNGPPFQAAKLRRAGLVELLDGWCISDVDGVRKPDRAIFELAARRCRTTLERAWMVGDNGATDIAGAVVCGLPSVWIRLGRRWSRPDYRPTSEAESLAGAIELIEAAAAAKR